MLFLASMGETGLSHDILFKFSLKGQLISNANCLAVNSSKKRTNEFVFTTMRSVFVCFLEEIEDTKKIFRNYLTFTYTVHMYFQTLWHPLDR